MDTVKSLFGCTGSPSPELTGATTLVCPDTYIGVEVEVESPTNLPNSVEGWNVVGEGSLGSMFAREYVFDSPKRVLSRKSYSDARLFSSLHWCRIPIQY